MTERILHEDGIELATEAFGNPAHPPVLLIMGVMASMLWWPDEFCRRLAAQGRYVIRYDNRDTGRSTTYEPGNPTYTFDDLADDAIRVLDGYGLPRAHLVAISMGGMIGQLATLMHPDRVITLTAISTSPFDDERHQPTEPSPSEPEQEASVAGPDFGDRDQVIASMVEDLRRLAGTKHPFDEAGLARLVGRDFDRARNYSSRINHTQLTGGEAWHGRLRELRAPLLVVHGTADPVFSVDHGIALAQAVGGAPVVQIDGMGHDLPEGDWDEIIDAIVTHTGASETDHDEHRA
jgi:pimeloyl-ACP methyl ester carboxylesterase